MTTDVKVLLDALESQVGGYVVGLPGGEAHTVRDVLRMIAQQTVPNLSDDIFKGTTSVEVLAWDRGWKEASRQAREFYEPKIEKLEADAARNVLRYTVRGFQAGEASRLMKDLANTDLSKKDIVISALSDLVNACEKEFMSEDESFDDNEGVMVSDDGDSPITFGMIKRARLALEMLV